MWCQVTILHHVAESAAERLRNVNSNDAVVVASNVKLLREEGVVCLVPEYRASAGPRT
jgi:hypothetical protein